jgi:conflict system STAND superfamily ATPase
VLCSPNWLQSKWCFAELAAAKMSGKQIFPIVLEDCDRSSLSEYQAVFINQADTATREEAFERLFQDLETRGLGPKDHLPWPNRELKDANGQIDDCPFPGLPAFDERYAAVYFGRERETQVVLEELRQMRTKGEPRLLMIVGGSGSGKSSLLMAGVLPRLKHTTSRADWLVLPTLRFGRRDYPDALFESLAEEIAARYPPDAATKGLSIPDRKTLRDQFAADDAAQAAKAFLDAARDLTFACGCKDATVLLPVDQFEEFLPPSGGANGTKFLKFLEQVCQHRNDRLLVIGTMRSDYLDVYERQPHALKAPTFYPWRLEPFPREQIANVIVKPAARAHVEVTPELLEQLKQ